MIGVAAVKTGAVAVGEEGAELLGITVPVVTVDT